MLEAALVPVHEKLFSLFEPHTDLLKRGKVQRPVEFGHKVFLAESRHGLITDYRVLDGNPVDEGRVPPSLIQHQATFGCPPALYAADRGFYTPDNVAAVAAAGVGTECVPQRGGQKTDARTAYEKSRAFKQGQRFRAGIEGRISVLLRGRGMRRCVLEGRARFEVFVGAAVLANNLLRIADLLSRRPARRRRAASLPPATALGAPRRGLLPRRRTRAVPGRRRDHCGPVVLLTARFLFTPRPTSVTRARFVCENPSDLFTKLRFATETSLGA